jgi:hypothetical protein
MGVDTVVSLERVPFECTGWIRGFSRNRLKARIQLTVYATGNRYKRVIALFVSQTSTLLAVG